MKSRFKFRSREQTPRRPASYRPEVLALEDRCLPGDALFGAVLGTSLMETSQAIAAVRPDLSEDATVRRMPAREEYLPAVAPHVPAMDGTVSDFVFARQSASASDDSTSSRNPPATEVHTESVPFVDWIRESDPFADPIPNIFGPSDTMLVRRPDSTGRK